MTLGAGVMVMPFSSAGLGLEVEADMTGLGAPLGREAAAPELEGRSSAATFLRGLERSSRAESVVCSLASLACAWSWGRGPVLLGRVSRGGMRVVPGGSLATAGLRSRAVLASLGAEMGLGDAVGVLVRAGGSGFMAAVMVWVAVGVAVAGLVVTEGRGTEITEISPLPWSTGGQDDLTGLTVTDILGLSGGLVTGELVVLVVDTVVMEIPWI